MKPTIIPTRQDDPAWFLFFRLDEILPFLILLIIGIVTHNTIPCLLIGWVFSYIYKKLNSKFPRGFVLHWLYGKGVYVFSASRTLRDPFNRKFLPVQIHKNQDGKNRINLKEISKKRK